ncbi:hypothetical protein CORT_0F03360 [Candida orthopsilosis Co 90-125]|uniref:Uncharacterized protein n=1 Tax=Candida orthopsilosis (strain 90-125) TaxID=1136231 RepID=H8X8T5_CANO9|nr:hypothetical protein CORT_0F03360 [Candida orthopsilosis Co 90-125]CCG24560.1 hypothetical protein CORT_0F03360 [Candida orthopsilosis Co 90-125]
MPRSISTSSFNLQQAPTIFASLDSPPIPNRSVTSFWINDKENLGSSSSNSPTNSILIASSERKKAAAYKSCETKLKRMMAEDENYSFILNPCCDKIDCKFVKNAILKDSKTRNSSRDGFVASIISIDSEDEGALSYKANDSLVAAPLRTSSVGKAIQVQPSEINDDTHSIYKDLFDELNACINSIHLQSQFDEKLSKLKDIIRGRKNRRIKT